MRTCAHAHASSLWGKETEPYDVQGSTFVQNCEVKSQMSMSKWKAQQVHPKSPPANEKTASPMGFTWVPQGGTGRTGASSSGAAGGGAGLSCTAGGGGHALSPTTAFTVSGASLQGMTLAKEIRDQERGGRTYVAVVDGENEKETPKLMEIMNYVLGQRGSLKAAVPDTVVEPALKAALKLYQ